MPNFIVFTGRGTPGVHSQPLVSIQRGRTFSFNKAAYEALGEPDSVEFLFDATEQIIGFRSVEQHVRHAYPVRKQQISSTYSIAAAAFLKQTGIQTDVRRRYKARMYGDVLGIDLKEQPVETGPRSKIETRTKHPAEDGQLSLAVSA